MKGFASLHPYGSSLPFSLHFSLLFPFARPPTHFSLKASKSLSLSFAYSHTHSSSDRSPLPRYSDIWASQNMTL